MRIQAQPLRRVVLEELRKALAARPGAQLFLLYSPGTEDPLRLSDAAPGESLGIKSEGEALPPRHNLRAVARIGWANLSATHQSRIIELDCRKVAPYLLETHPGIDDPLLEESLTFAETYLRRQPAAETEEPRGRHVAGWLISTDTPTEIARRFAHADRVPRTQSPGAQHGVAWHDPRVAAGLWSSLTAAQRLALLGEATEWIAVDAVGQIVRFAIGGDTPSSAVADLAAQKAHLQDSPAVLMLLEAWRDQCAERGEPLPTNAMQRMQGFVRHARQAGLDGEDLRAYGLWATRLRPGFEAEPAVREALAEAARNPDTLAQLLPAVLTGPLLARHAMDAQPLNDTTLQP